jgi:hypothetical protein
MKPITRDAAREMADHLRSAYPIDRSEVAEFLEAVAAHLPEATQTSAQLKAAHCTSSRETMDGVR